MNAKGLIQKRVPAAQPKWLLYTKIVVLVLSIIVLALAAYAISLYGRYYYGSSGAAGFDIFIAILTFIVYGLDLAAEFYAPQLYFRIIALVCFSLSVIFWLVGWAWSASEASAWPSYCDRGRCRDEGGAMAGTAATGAIAWVIYIVNLVFFIRACLAEPRGSATVQRGQDAELGQVSGQPKDQFVVAHPPPERQSF